MSLNKIVVPYVNFEKFYRIAAFKSTSPNDVNLSEPTFKSYSRFRSRLFNGNIKAESFTIFLDKLRNAVISKLISKKTLNKLLDKPINPTTLKKLINSQGKEISNSSSKALLSLLRKLHLIDQVNIIKRVSGENERERDKDLIFYYLLRRKAFLTVKDVKEKFSSHPRKHKINHYLLELWLEGQLEIKDLDIPREICKEFGFEEIPPNEVEKFESVETFRKRKSGELKAKVDLREEYKVYPVSEGEEK